MCTAKTLSEFNHLATAAIRSYTLQINIHITTSTHNGIFRHVCEGGLRAVEHAEDEHRHNGVHRRVVLLRRHRSQVAWEYR